VGIFLYLDATKKMQSNFGIKMANPEVQIKVSK